MLKEKDITVKAETIEDAILATEMLKDDPRIDKERVFIVGHSMGAMLAPRIDAEGGNYKGLILMAGSPRRLEEIMIDQSEAILQSEKSFLRWFVNKQLEKIIPMFEGLYELSDEEAKKKKVGGGTTLYYFKEMGEHPVADYLDKLEKPVMIMHSIWYWQPVSARSVPVCPLLQLKTGVPALVVWFSCTVPLLMMNRPGALA